MEEHMTDDVTTLGDEEILDVTEAGKQSTADTDTSDAGDDADGGDSDSDTDDSDS